MKFSQSIFISIATIGLDIVILIFSLVNGLYSVYKVFADYGVAMQTGAAAAFRGLWPHAVFYLVIFVVLIVVLVGQLRKRRWGVWIAVAVHITVAIVYAISMLVLGFLDWISLITAVILICNLIAAVTLLWHEWSRGQQIATPP
jgi:hypothetical protein